MVLGLSLGMCLPEWLIYEWSLCIGMDGMLTGFECGCVIPSWCCGVGFECGRVVALWCCGV